MQIGRPIRLPLTRVIVSDVNLFWTLFVKKFKFGHSVLILITQKKSVLKKIFLSLFFALFFVSVKE